MTDIKRLLNTTLAGQMAQKLDAKDGSRDGKINHSIWNSFVEDKGGNEVQEYISIKDAMNSITTYLIRKASETGKAINDLVAEWSNKAGLDSNEIMRVEDIETAPGGASPAAAEEEEETPAAVEETPAGEEVATASSKGVEADYKSVAFKLSKKTYTVPTDIKEIRMLCGKNTTKAIDLANELKELLKNADNWSYEGIKKAREFLTTQITETNVAHIVLQYPDIIKDIDNVSLFGMGFDTDDAMEFIWDKLVTRARKYGNEIIDVTRYKFPEDVTYLATVICNADLVASQAEYVKANAVNKFNEELPKIQKTFDEANMFLAEVANMNPPAEVTSGTDDDGDNWKQAKLPDERWIKVRYDKNGEIEEILISHDTTPDHKDDGTTTNGDDVSYTKDKASVDTDKSNFKYEHFINITNEYDFEKLKTLAEKIFGPWDEDEG